MSFLSWIIVSFAAAVASALALSVVEAPALFGLMFGEQAECAYAAAGEQMRGWAEAFGEWLAETGKRAGRKRVQERRLIWRRFLEFLQGPPWQASGEDVTRWGEALTAQGLRPGTVKIHLGKLSGFYEFCGRKSAGLFPEGKVFNPARQAHRPAVKAYERASCLSAQEVQALLRAVDRETSVVGKRDYALLLTCLATGWTIGKVRRMRWGEGEEGQGIGGEGQGIGDKGIGEEGGGDQRIYVEGGEFLRVGERTGDKGIGGRGISADGGDFLEEGEGRGIGEAVEDYLRAAGRWEGMQAGEYVFAPFVDGLNRKPSGKREDWNGSKPLSADQTHFLLKRYAGWAGLDSDKVNYHCLRHTARLLHAEAGREAESIQAFGGMQSLSKTRGYVKRMRHALRFHSGQTLQLRSGQAFRLRSGQAGELAAKRGKPGEHGPYQRKRGKLQPGDQLNLRHGLYAKQAPGQETGGSAAPGESAEPQPKGRREKAIARLRWVIRRTFDLGEEAQTAKQLAILLEVMGTAVERLSRLIKGARKQAERKSASSSQAEEFIKRLDEGQKGSSENGDDIWPVSQEAIDPLKNRLSGEVEEGGFEELNRDGFGMENELSMLDRMIERAEAIGRGNIRLDEGLALLNAVSQAEMRRERCAGMEETEDEKLREVFQEAIKELWKEWRQESRGSTEGENKRMKAKA